MGNLYLNEAVVAADAALTAINRGTEQATQAILGLRQALIHPGFQGKAAQSLDGQIGAALAQAQALAARCTGLQAQGQGLVYALRAGGLP